MLNHGGEKPFYRAVLACVLVFACAGAMAQETELAKVMQLLSQVKSSTVRFTETKHMAALREPLTLSGRLRYERGRVLERDIDAPYEESMIVEGQSVVVASPARSRIRSYSLRGVPAAWAFVEGLRATLGGDLDTLERYFRVTFSGAVGAWKIELVPLDEEMARYVEAIVFRGSRADITSIRVGEASGDSSLMTIRPDAS
jgi:Outer membrane lipoprotein carrier protein LolA-like